MGIAQTTVITCDDCKETLGEGMNFFYMQTQPVGTVAPPFANVIAFCDTTCLKAWASKLA